MQYKQNNKHNAVQQTSGKQVRMKQLNSKNAQN